MSTPAPALQPSLREGPSPRWPRWAREPLLHFVVLGALLFGLDHLFATREGDPRVIVVSSAVDAEARRVFEQARGRAPDSDELYALRRVWLDNEVLYREGLAMRLDRGDAAIRERVIFKALSVVDANVKLPRYDEKVLRAWFDARKDKYDLPARYDFQEAMLVGDGDDSEAAAREFADALNHGAPSLDARANLRVFKARPHQNIVDSYGVEFARALERATPGTWAAYRSQDAWRVVRLDARTAGEAADFERLRGVVLHDWTDAVLSDQRSAAVKALAAKYTVKYDAESAP